MGEVDTGFWWGNLREGDHLKDPGINERIIWDWGTWTGLILYFYLAHNSDRWQAVVNEVMNLQVLQNAGNFLTS
jgi:hypothetical protein